MNIQSEVKTPTAPQTPPVLVEFTRGDLVECVGRGYVCVVDSAGELIYNQGDPDFMTYLRSTAKPLQALSVILSGAAASFRLEDREISLICGSHAGEEIHTETVASILLKGGLDPTFLQCGTHLPFDKATRNALLKAGTAPKPLHHNCSGKHSGMLLTAQHCGESLADYLDPASPTQQRITENIAIMAGVSPADIPIGIDGCSAPVHGLTMRNAAHALARLIEPEGLDPLMASATVTIGRSMRTYPEMVAGNTERICTELMRVGRVFELTAKGGAEGYYGAAWRDPQTGKGMGLTVKIEDGAQRSRDPLTIAMLQKFGVLPDKLNEALANFAAQPIRNHSGKIIGDVHCCI